MLSKSKVKYIQTLGHKKFRDKDRLFIAEGPKLVNEVLSSEKVVINEIFAVKEWIVGNSSFDGKAAVTEVSQQELEKISQLATPNKVLALVNYLEEENLKRDTTKIILALDTIQDPGNLGTIVRLADWFGINQVVCSYECADIYNPKVVQSTMGSIARVNVSYTHLEEWLVQQTESIVYATALDGEDITGMEKIKKGIIVIGNESKGISQKVLNLSAKKITIPRKGDAESLNAAVATGIILSHLLL